MQQTAG